ncbi:MAG: aldo/keto reductase, partial [archaeon]|nr:aldo/keto reductase [archaeon]
PAIGQGAWGIKKYKPLADNDTWKQALKYGLDIGINAIDTAEFYGNGLSEQLVGEVVKEYDRDKIYITSKVWLTHLGYNQLLKACDRSLKRLNMEYIDLYLIHWPNPIFPLKKTMAAMEKLHKEGKIKHIGVSNFSPDLIKKANNHLKDTEVVANQIEISMEKPNNIKKHHTFACEQGITLFAWSPLGGKGLRNLKSEQETALQNVAKKNNLSKFQVALAWLGSHERVIPIPRSTNPDHILKNKEAAEIILDKEDIRIINHSVGF